MALTDIKAENAKPGNKPIADIKAPMAMDGTIAGQSTCAG